MPNRPTTAGIEPHGGRDRLCSLLSNSMILGVEASARYRIGQSEIFSEASPAYLQRTPSVSGNRKTFTFSFWFKQGRIPIAGTFNWLLSEGASSSAYAGVYIERSNSQLRLFQWDGSSYTLNTQTAMVWRDPMAWRHIVIVVDTTQSTATDRAKIYDNGELAAIASGATYPAQNTDLHFSEASTLFTVGGVVLPPSSYAYCDGYIADFHWIDGTALSPSDFGETDLHTNQWLPKPYVGSYGTNGIYLDFADAANPGTDSSGNGNNLTASGLSASDQVLDTPTNNFCTLNPLAVAGTTTLSNGNLTTTVQYDGSTYSRVMSSFAFDIATSKVSWEVTIDDVGGQSHIGVKTVNTVLSGAGGLGSNPGEYVYLSTGQKYSTSGASTYGATYTTGDVLEVYVDNGSLGFKKNGVDQGTAFSGLTGTFSPAFGAGGSTGQYTIDFGQSGYTAATGYMTLCADNLPVPSIKNAHQHFRPLLYVGDGTTSHAITGVGFQPDFTWLKNRSAANDHALYDVLRGAGNVLVSNLTIAESSVSGVSSFDPDGFTLGISGVGNTSGNDYVSWNWKAGGSGSINNDGSISSTVSVNAPAGFSIVTYTGTGAVATVGHGLGATPKIVIVKNRQGTNGWTTYFVQIGAGNYVQLNVTGGYSASSAVWNNTAPTDTVFTLGTDTSVNQNGFDYVAYCFTDVEGYCNIFQYTGNGSTDGPCVHLGFRPAFLLVKRWDSSSNWIMWDNKRPGYNVTNLDLAADVANAEPVNSLAVDLLAGGFKLRTISNPNISGGNYMGLAIAETPFKYSNAV